VKKNIGLLSSANDMKGGQDMGGMKGVSKREIFMMEDKKR